ncbi:hypothetical protein BY996DRAFT_6996582 [Phakopsora pachyrhizi]|nr:hypothetical protein BY996DRAFT_6996582 [Phakopsora pachyrhizi]
MSTTSDKGTVIRIFISFNLVSSLLAVSSDTNTNHIFKLVCRIVTVDLMRLTGHLGVVTDPY